MQYTLSEINNGIAKVVWSDGSWSYVEMTSEMTEAEFDDAVFRAIPPNLKTGSKPSFASAGTTRTAAAKPAETVTTSAPTDDRPDWMKARQTAYGGLPEQIEYITENGLEAWQTKVAQIKADNPKS
tara:strand:+ start:190 stop:567 length:378 start_codon:yes stop_codon:yes gene_type:complete